MRAARLRLLPALFVALVFVGFGSVVLETPALWETPEGIEGPTTGVIGEAFFEEFLAVFELTAVLLVAALVAGVYLAKSEESRSDAVRKAVERKPRVEGEGKEVDDGSD